MVRALSSRALPLAAKQLARSGRTCAAAAAAVGQWPSAVPRELVRLDLCVRQGLLRVVGVALEFGRAAVPYLAPRHQVSKASLGVNRCYGPVKNRFSVL